MPPSADGGHRIPRDVVAPLRALLRGDAIAWPPAAAGPVAVGALDHHGVTPLVHDAARRAGVDLPADVAEAAKRAYVVTGARSALVLRARARVVEALDAAGARTVVLKGAALLGTAWEDVALRPMTDLDLLVDAADLAAADAALVALGYRRVVDDLPVALRHHAAYRPPGADGLVVPVELHHRLLASPPFDRALAARDVLARAVPLGDAGGPGRMPDLPDRLLHAAAHLVVQHARAERLIWVADLDRLARAAGDDGAVWAALAARAEAAGLARAAGDALAAAALWFDTPLPAAARALATAPAPAALRRLRGRAAVGREGARLLDDARGLPTWRARAALAARAAFPSPARMRAWYGVDRPARLPIYYAARVARGLWHVAAHLARRPAERRRALEPPEQWMIER